MRIEMAKRSWFGVLGKQVTYRSPDAVTKKIIERLFVLHHKISVCDTFKSQPMSFSFAGSDSLSSAVLFLPQKW
jgi:hypothetical protein